MKGKDKGFSLIEIIMVIALLGVLSSIIGVGVPAYQRFSDKRQLEMQAKEILYTILEARNKALMDGEKRRVWIFQDENKIIVTNLNNHHEPGKEVILSKGIEIIVSTYRAFDNKLDLNPIGTVSQGGHITLGSPLGEYVTIVVQIGNGRIYMKEGMMYG